MSIATKAALERLLYRYVENCRHLTGSDPLQAHDPAWPSECQAGEPDERGMIRWQPRARERPADFGGLERALEVEVHPDIKSFYGSYWAGTIDLEAEEGGVTLIQVWNDDDFDRLVKNILGHAIAKQRIGAPLTIFIACTDEGELMLSVENDTGQVVLEEPGSLPIRVVSPTLTAFLDRLTPVAQESNHP